MWGFGVAEVLAAAVPEEVLAAPPKKVLAVVPEEVLAVVPEEALVPDRDRAASSSPPTILLEAGTRLFWRPEQPAVE